MKSTEPGHRPANRKVPKTKPDPKIKTVGVTEEAFVLVEASAKKLKMSKSRYTSAAIAYFAASGLNPEAAKDQTLAGFALRLKDEGRACRQQTVDVGNRLISIMRTWEKANYAFMQQMHTGMVNHMEQIESNLLQQLVGLESSYFAPMVEMIQKSTIEANYARVIGEKLDLHVRGDEESEWAAWNKRVNKNRDQKLMELMREFIKNNQMEKPTLSPKPQPLAIPVKAPAAPAAVPAAGGTAPK